MPVGLTILGAALVAFIARAVATGRWGRTWAGSGRKPDGRRFPGGPTRP